MIARTLTGLAAVAVGVATTGLALAPSASASASVTPTLSLNQSGGTQAGSTVPLGTDIKFSYSNSGDTPKDITLTLPPGLLANAAINHGQCLKTTTLSSACQVGSGMVTAKTTSILPTSLSVPISLYLVPPPTTADLAGIQIVNDTPLIGGPLGGPGVVKVIGPDAHVSITISNIPNSVPIALGVSSPISIQEMQTTLTGMRLPTNCGALPRFKVGVDTWDGAHGTVSQPLTVGGCSNLIVTPTFAVTAVKDASDSGVQVATDLRQPQPKSTPLQAAARSTVLTLPTNVLGPNVAGALKVLCATLSSSCTPIGTATSVSPLYPTPLTGKAYLVGQLTALRIAIVFPPPFSLSLSGSVDELAGSTTFTGIPDLPLSDLKVVLNGGPNAVFAASCNPAAGTASATVTSQNGDKTGLGNAHFTVSGCTGIGSGGGAQGGGSHGSGGSGGSGSHQPPAHRGRPRVASASLSGLGHGLATLRLRLLAGTNAPKLRSIAIELPHGLRFRHGRIHGRALTRVRLSNAKVRSVGLIHGRLLIKLSRAVGAFAVRIPGLGESSSLERKARHHHVRKLTLGLGVTDASGVGTLVKVTIRSLHL
jgi:hypothetical protein